MCKTNSRKKLIRRRIWIMKVTWWWSWATLICYPSHAYSFYYWNRYALGSLYDAKLEKSITLSSMGVKFILTEQVLNYRELDQVVLAHHHHFGHLFILVCILKWKHSITKHTLTYNRKKCVHTHFFWFTTINNFSPKQSFWQIMKSLAAFEIFKLPSKNW